MCGSTGLPVIFQCSHGGAGLISCSTTGIAKASAVSIISGTADGVVHEWSTKEHRRSIHRALHTGAVHCLDVSHDSTLGLSCGYDRRICLFILGKSRRRPNSVFHTTSVNSAQFSPDSELVISSGNDKLVKVWTVSDGRLIFSASFVGHTHHVRFAAFTSSPGNTHIASCGDDKTVRLWDCQKHTDILCLKDPETPLLETHSAPDSVCSDLISSCGYDGSITIWDIRSSEVVQHYRAHDGPVNSMSFHHSLPMIVSGSDDCSVRMWDLRAGKLLCTLYGHGGPVKCVRFQRPLVDGSTKFVDSFITASTDGQLLFWDAPLCTRLCSHLPCFLSLNVSISVVLTMKSAVLAAIFVPITSGFHLPGNAPREYKVGDKVDLKVSKLTSDVYQVPYEYYYLNFCPSESGSTKANQMDESLGQILLGDVVVDTPYSLKMKSDEPCKVVCRRPINSDEYERFAYLIDGEYVINWLVDSLPAATKKSGHSEEDSSVVSESWFEGFPIGYKSGDKYYINNHASFVIKYHEPAEVANGKGYRIVGVDVEPKSVSIDESFQRPTEAFCEDSIGFGTPMEITAESPSILFTYSVKWERSDVSWASRWDTYLKIKENRIHWFSIINSLVIVILLTGLIGLVMVRTLHKDITRYNSIIMDEETSALDDDSNEESGWKLVHADVFRKPRHSKLLSVFVGSGVQILFMLLVSLALAAIGLVSPAQRGSYIQAMLLLYTFMGSIAGYVSAKMYKMFKGEDWRTTTLMSGLIFPGVAFATFFSINLLLWYVDSSAAVDFSAMALLLLLWVGISIPLVYVGAYRGYSQPPVEFPVRVHHIPRQVPRQPWYSRILISSKIGGILPFGAVSTELVFLMGSIWHHQFYYLFGFLFVVLLILIVTCAEISMVMTYFQLTNEDYRWWWRSFLTSAFSGVYVFIYSLIYLATKLNIIGFVPTVLYLGYMGLAAFSFFLLTGSIGAISSFYFVKSIYGSIKVD